jgi:Holliday junction resolvase RusA-like endonuclease
MYCNSGMPWADCQVYLALRFVVPRPEYHYNKAGQIKDKYKSAKPIKKGTKDKGGYDVTKLQRAVEDALSGTIFKDDSQVCSAMSIKRFRLEKDASCGVHILAWVSETKGQDNGWNIQATGQGGGI